MAASSAISPAEAFGTHAASAGLGRWAPSSCGGSVAFLPSRYMWCTSGQTWMRSTKSASLLTCSAASSSVLVASVMPSAVELSGLHWFRRGSKMRTPLPDAACTVVTQLASADSVRAGGRPGAPVKLLKGPPVNQCAGIGSPSTTTEAVPGPATPGVVFGPDHEAAPVAASASSARSTMSPPLNPCPGPHAPENSSQGKFSPDLPPPHHPPPAHQ